MDQLKTFHTICSFVKELQELFGKKYYNITLYNRFLEKTPITNESAITKHIQIFSDFLNKNKEAIMTKNLDKFVWDKVIYNKKIFINMKEIMQESDTQTKNSIWNYLLAISFSQFQTDDLKDKLKEILSSSSSSETGENESKFIKNFMTRIEDKFKDKDFKDPMSATAELLQSGVFTDMVKNMNEEIQSGNINVNKLLGSVQGMLGNLGGDGQAGGNMPDLSSMMSMVNNMMGSMGNMNNGGGMPDIGNLLGSLGNMMQGDMFGGMQQNTNNGEQVPSLEDLLQPITHEPSTETESKGNDVD